MSTPERPVERAGVPHRVEVGAEQSVPASVSQPGRWPIRVSRRASVRVSIPAWSIHEATACWPAPSPPRRTGVRPAGLLADRGKLPAAADQVHRAGLNYGSRSAVLLATWNLENLFRPRAAPSARTTSGSTARRSPPWATGSPTWRRIVLAVQEVGDAAALDDVLKRAGGRWQVVLSDFPDERGIRVGLASRSRLAEVGAGAFPERIAPVQVDDRGTTIAAAAAP